MSVCFLDKFFSHQTNNYLAAPKTTNTDERQESSARAIWSAPQTNSVRRRWRRSIWQSLGEPAGRPVRQRGSRARAEARAPLGDNYRDEDFAIDDGDEDAWVHDGIDDIHIDPETRRAASELSRDEQASIEAEYAEQQPVGSAPLVNRTRVTTISEVIPTGAGEAERGQVAPAPLLPAAYLSLEQVEALVGERRARGRDGEQEREEEEEEE